MRDIIVIGGGAAGMTAAIICARLKKEVTLLEHNEKIGRKLLATGNGKCNFTNEYQEKECYRGENPDFAWNLITRYGKEEYLSFLDSIGVYPKNKAGYFYPYSEQASSVLDALMEELYRYKVKIKCMEHVKAIEPIEAGYRVVTNTYAYEAKKVILACGGTSYAVLGSDGSGYTLAKGLGHSITKLFPALVGLRSKRTNPKLAGIRIKGEISIYVEEKLEAKESGEIQFTAYGISGIPVFQVSRFATRALAEEKHVTAKIKLLPEMTDEQITAYMVKQKEYNPDKSLLQLLQNFMDSRMAEDLLNRCGLKKNRSIHSLSEEEQNQILYARNHFELSIDGQNDFEQAQVTGGGVDTNEVNAETLESNLHKGVYFCGEILDIDGTCGGYNLQWAFTSGYIAAINAAR